MDSAKPEKFLTFIRNLVEKISILGGWVGEGKGEECATKVPAVKIFKMCVGRLTFNTIQWKITAEGK